MRLAERYFASRVPSTRWVVRPSYFSMIACASFDIMKATKRKLFVAFMMSKEAQAIIEKYDGRTTHLVEGTRLAKYLSANRIKLQAPADAMAAYVKSEGGEGLKFKEELAKMLKQ